MPHSPSDLNSSSRVGENSPKISFLTQVLAQATPIPSSSVLEQSCLMSTERRKYIHNLPLLQESNSTPFEKNYSNIALINASKCLYQCELGGRYQTVVFQGHAFTKKEKEYIYIYPFSSVIYDVAKRETAVMTVLRTALILFGPAVNPSSNC